MTGTGVAPRTSLTIHRVQVGGQRLVAKCARGGARSLVRREAELLAALGGAPVTQLVALRESDDRTDLVMRDAGAIHLGAPTGCSPAALHAAVTAATAAVEQLHASGWSHGAICGDHLVVDEVGRVTLCSLGSARPLCDDPDAIQEDLAQLRAVIDRLGHHRDPSWNRAASREWQRLHRRLVHHDGTGPSRSVAALVGGAVALGLVSLVLGALTQDPDESHAAPLTTAPLTTAPTTTAASTAAPSTAAPPTTAAATDGRLLRVDGRVYRAGQPGDVLAIHDANCTGRPQVLLLRPGTGEVFRFDRWPEADQPVRARLQLIAPGAERFDTVRRDGCVIARLVHRDGSTSEVPTPPPDPTNGAPEP